MNHNEEWNQPMENQPPERLPAEEQLAEFEVYLTQSLRPVDPPGGFTERIVARALSARPGGANVLRMRPRVRILTGGAIAASLLASLLIAGQEHTRREKVERAERQFHAALQITNETLEQTRDQLRQAGIETGN